VKQELAELVALVEKSGNAVLGFHAQVAEKIDRAEAEKLIDKQKKALLTSIEVMGLRLEKQIVLNRQKIAALKDKAVVKKSTSKAASAPKKTPAPKPAPKQAEKPAQSAPQPGEIVEQDL
jgi:hypothetical protein